MDREPFTYIQPRNASHGEKEASKTVPLRSFSLQSRLEETQFSEGEQNSRSNTPSMTYGSSRSNSSSIITCEACGNSGNHCTCTSLAESETFRHFNREEWTQSPHSSPALITRQIKGKVPSQASRLRLVGTRFSCPKPAGKTSACLLLESDQHLDLDSEPSTPCNPFSSFGKERSPSHALNDTNLPPSALSEGRAPRNAIECVTSDSEAEDDEDGSDDDGEDDEDDDWSGQDGNLEAIILNAVGDDLPLAAHLIPILHRSLRSEFALNATEKLGSWRYGVIKSAQGSEEAGEQGSANYKGDTTNNPRKRQRRHGCSGGQGQKSTDFDDEDEDEDDDEPQDSKGLENDPGTGGQQPLPRLACPFYKRDPGKYGIQHGDDDGPRKAEFRACEGPGFKNIQRLKEHLKRKHYPVQCDRCYHIFPGTDRAACVLELQDHRQLAIPCERSDSGKEGISEAQWANLDKKKSSKKSRVQSRIAMWFEYWAILFPGIPQPETPWYDNKNPNRTTQPTSDDVSRFAGFFRPMLNLKVNQQYIRFLEGPEEDMKTRVETLVYQAFSMYLDLYGSPSITNSSSSRSRQQVSLLGGSFQRLSTPRTSRGPVSSSDSRSTAAQSQAYSMEVAPSPTPLSMARRSLSQPTGMRPPFMAVQQMPAPNFGPTTPQSPLPNEQPTHRGFHSSITGNLESFADPFVNNQLGAEDLQWEHMNFNDTNASFFGSHTAPNLNSTGYLDISSSPLDQILDATEDNARNMADLGAFDQYQTSQNLRYNGAQQ